MQGWQPNQWVRLSPPKFATRLPLKHSGLRPQAKLYQQVGTCGNLWEPTYLVDQSKTLTKNVGRGKSEHMYVCI